MNFFSQDKKKTIELELGLAKAYCSNEKYSKCLGILNEVTQFENGDGDMKPDLDLCYEQAAICFKQAQSEYASLFVHSHLVSLSLSSLSSFNPMCFS